MPHHHPHHHFRRSSQYSEQFVGVLRRLLDRAGDFADLDALKRHLTNREPGELKYLEPALAELETAGKEGTPMNVLLVMACNKTIEFFQREKERVLHGLNGNGVATPDDGPHHALILPVPPRQWRLLEDITPGKLYVLPGHPVPHELDEWKVLVLPTPSRTIKAEMATLQSITFDGHIDNTGRVLTRRVIADLLAYLADFGIKPLLRVVSMPHLPHHEDFDLIEDGYKIEIIFP